MKKITSIIISMFLMLPILSIGAIAETTTEFSQDLPAKSYYLIEASTGKVLAEKNPDEQMPPASITKIMTMLLLMERIESGEMSLDDMVTTSEHANSMGGTQIWLEVGEQMSIHDLLKATAINSANDAATALAEHMAGTEEQFATLMNNRAKELGMTQTNFCNASGLDADGHVSSAKDIAIMAKELLKYEKITEFTSVYMDSLRDGKTGLVNTNKLVRFYEGCNGIKTGTTDGAGSCLCASAKRDDMTLIAVSMGSTTSNERFSTCRSLLDYGFASWKLYKPELTNEDLNPIKVNKGQVPNAEVKTNEKSNSILIPASSKGNIEKVIDKPDSVDAPIKQGDKIGEVKYMLNGEQIAAQDLIVNLDVKEIDFPFVFFGLFRALLTGK